MIVLYMFLALGTVTGCLTALVSALNAVDRYHDRRVARRRPRTRVVRIWDV